MSTQTNNPAIAGIAGAAVSQYRLLKMDTDAQEAIHCTETLTDVPIGVSQNGAAEGEALTIRLLSAGTCKVTAAVAIAKGNKCYAAAAGKVTDTPATGRFVGIAMTDASGDGSVFEMLPAGEAGASFDQVDLAAATATGDVTALTGTLTGTANGALVDVAAAAANCAGAGSPSATNVDTAIATAVATIVSGTNEQLKELQTSLATLIGEYNKLRADFVDLRAKGVTAGLWLT